MTHTGQMSEQRGQLPIIAVAFTLAFVVLASYEIVRSPVESLFLERHSIDELPRVWMLVAAGALAVVAIYNRFAARLSLVRLFRASVVVSIVSGALLLGLDRVGTPLIAYALYVWKDVYIVVLVEGFWSIANATFRVRSARWLYGLFCAVGSLGAMAGDAAGGAIALRWGTENELWFVLPLLAVAWLLAVVLQRLVRIDIPPGERAPSPKFSEGVAVLRRSRYLLWVLTMVLLVQVVVTLVDFEFHSTLREAIDDTDTRTAFIHKVYFFINLGALVLQGLTGPILKLAGAARTLVAIPLVVGGSVVAFALAPGVGVVAFAKVAGKCFDYSLFRAAKEILYIPLSYAEKTQGKAFVDILAYRVAKGGASLLLQAILLVASAALVSWVAVLFVFAWLAVAIVIGRRYRDRGSE